MRGIEVPVKESINLNTRRRQRETWVVQNFMARHKGRIYCRHCLSVNKLNPTVWISGITAQLPLKLHDLIVP